jgi:hypothetical protein
VTEKNSALAPFLVSAPGSANTLEPDDYLKRLDMTQRLLLTDRGLHYLAQYGTGARHFDVDLLAAVRTADGPDAEVSRRLACRRIARKLSFQAAVHLDGWLADLETGPLIRTVLETGNGALFCDRVVPGTFLIGVSVPLGDSSSSALSVPDVDTADSALALLISELRQEILLSTQDLGGWDSEQLRERLRQAELDVAAAPAEVSSGVAVTTVVDGRQDDHRGVALCREKVSPADLHLVALYDDDGLLFSVDVLNDERLYLSRQNYTATLDRRTRYQRLGVELPAYLRELSRTARSVIGGPLQRGVLDVEQGAIYYRRLDNTQYLMGLTLYQDQVKRAEDALLEISLAWPDA